MAATVVSVVVFLCGVLVGRGVGTERWAARAIPPALNAVTTAETTPQQPRRPPLRRRPVRDPTAATPPPAVDDLTYLGRLEKPTPPAEELKPTPERPAAALPARRRARRRRPPQKSPAPPPRTRDARRKEPASSPAEPRRPGLRAADAQTPRPRRSRRDRQAPRVEALRRLRARARDGTPAVFRVRIGKFKDPARRRRRSRSKLQRRAVQPWISGSAIS